ncbi:MAG: hypothetical protein EA383_14745 [Spirochaetaceae bacterium]|nr:MAG: hypothetical protein EA383_14745 [Spirochaetaceae bacterium]
MTDVPGSDIFSHEVGIVAFSPRWLNGLVSIIRTGLSGRFRLLPWPKSPLYIFPESDPYWTPPHTVEEAMKAVEGRYAHYDVVAYQDVTTRKPMLTFVVSYGFTEFRIENERLMQIDTFCHAEQILNQVSSEVVFSDAATRAIQPPAQEVEICWNDGRWHLYRPASPTLLGIAGDPSKPLSTDPNDPNLLDPDGDGNPGVTVSIRVGDVLEGDIYITRREIYQHYLVLNSNGNLYGHVVDESEQFVVGASRRMFRRESNMEQIADPGMSPIMLVRVGEDFDTCEGLMSVRDRLFPPEPSF